MRLAYQPGLAGGVKVALNASLGIPPYTRRTSPQDEADPGWLTMAKPCPQGRRIARVRRVPGRRAPPYRSSRRRPAPPCKLVFGFGGRKPPCGGTGGGTGTRCLPQSLCLRRCSIAAAPPIIPPKGSNAVPVTVFFLALPHFIVHRCTHLAFVGIRFWFYLNPVRILSATTYTGCISIIATWFKARQTSSGMARR